MLPLLKLKCGRASTKTMHYVTQRRVALRHVAHSPNRPLCTQSHRLRFTLVTSQLLSRYHCASFCFHYSPRDMHCEDPSICHCTSLHPHTGCIFQAVGRYNVFCTHPQDLFFPHFKNGTLYVSCLFPNAYQHWMALACHSVSSAERSRA